MSFEDFIANKVKEAAADGYYRVDVKAYRECWDVAYAEGLKEGMKKAFLDSPDPTCESAGIF